MGRIVRTLLMVACGFATSIGTAILLYRIERRTGLVLYGITFWFILPVGAAFCGALAASGYPIAGRRLHVAGPSSLLFLVMLTSVGTLVLINWLQFSEWCHAQNIAGDLSEFFRFVRFSLTHSSLHVGFRGHLIRGLKVGAGGYILAAAQLVGFIFGGLMSFGLLLIQPYCKVCSRFTKLNATQLRHFEDEEEGRSATGLVFEKAKSGDLQKAIYLQASSGTPEMTASAAFLSSIRLWRCTTCERNTLFLTAKRRVKASWKVVSKFDHTSTTIDQLQTEEVPSSGLISS